MRIYTVGGLTGYLKELIESDALLQDLWIEGEVSNFSVSSAGHAYFTLKDGSSQLRCALFKSRLTALRGYRPSNGDVVVIHGRISVYEAQGSYQLYVDMVQPAGVGAFHLQFELLRQQLDQEGLFDQYRKRPLPRTPRRIGVVTSPTGSVLHDIINVVRRRYPLTELVLSPTVVQGAEAAPQICRALHALNEFGDLDVIIVARGGGSLEELWPFNEESVARAIYASRIPIVTGVGHETDYTIADLVADVRAPTPSAAAELVVPDVREYALRLSGWQQQLPRLVEQRYLAARQGVVECSQMLARYSPLAIVDRKRQQADDLATRSRVRLGHLIELRRMRVEIFSRQLGALDPHAVLGRGYSICRQGEVVIRSAAQVAPGDFIQVRVADGEFDSTIVAR